MDRWNNSEIQYLMRYAGTMRAAEMSTILGRRPGAIRKKANRMGLYFSKNASSVELRDKFFKLMPDMVKTGLIKYNFDIASYILTATKHVEVLA